MIRVYHFRLWDDDAGRYIVSPYKSPAEVVSCLGGTILAETSESVAMSDLENEQRYDPRPRRRKLWGKAEGEPLRSQ
jgi:hypothetical protein